MSFTPNVPAGCRQLLQSQGKPHPKSNCAGCGSLAPRWRACDLAIKNAPRAWMIEDRIAGGEPTITTDPQYAAMKAEQKFEGSPAAAVTALFSGASPLTLAGVVGEIHAERARQIAGEGHAVEGDDLYKALELPKAAAAYCLTASGQVGLGSMVWPWPDCFKPTTARRDLIKAAALIVAEIERLDRSEAAR